MTWVNRIIETRMVTAEELLANPKNWRKHPPSQARSLLGVLQKVGIVTPLLAYYSERAGGALTLIDGHLRLEQGGVWPCTIVNLTDEEADYVLLTHDPLTAMAYGDPDLLDDLIKAVEIDDEAVDAMVNALGREAGISVTNDEDDAEMADADVDVEEEAALVAKWGVKQGDVWEMGHKRHRIMVGDCQSAEDVEMLLGWEIPLMMVTNLSNDQEYDVDVDWEVVFSLFPGFVAYTWSLGGAEFIQAGAALLDAGFEIRNEIVWKKPHFAIGRGHYTFQHAPCWYAVKQGAASNWRGDATASTVWEIALEKDAQGEKPLECYARPIRNHAGNVYDPCLSKGATLMAAEALGRCCYGMGKTAEDVALTLERFHRTTGQVPTKVRVEEGELIDGVSEIQSATA